MYIITLKLKIQKRLWTTNTYNLPKFDKLISSIYIHEQLLRQNKKEKHDTSDGNKNNFEYNSIERILDPDSAKGEGSKILAERDARGIRIVADEAASPGAANCVSCTFLSYSLPSGNAFLIFLDDAISSQPICAKTFCNYSRLV